MPVPQYGCPCGASVADPNGLVVYLTDTLIDTLLTGLASAAKFGGLVAPFIGNTVNVAALCAADRVPEPTWNLSDFTPPQNGLAKAGLALAGMLYDNLCSCDACPPASDCGVGGTQLVVVPEMGYTPDPDEPRIRFYKIPSGDMYVSRYDGYCYGLKNGTAITWYLEYAGPNQYGVTICEGNETGCVSFTGGANITPVTLTFSDTPGKPADPWKPAPDGIEDWYGPPACTNDDICAALAVTEERIRRIEYVASILYPLLVGATGNMDFTLPGIPTPFSGNLAEILQRAIPALAPITPAQLATPETTALSESGVIDLTDLAYVSIVPSTVPDWLGYRGTDDARVYYSNHRTPGPGWVVVWGDTGVLLHREILYPAGIEFVVPSMASQVAVELSAGVAVSVTTYTRVIPA